ncbi:hypothetical protein BJX65DRAFT_81687 [Aspergillus insuetus]
MTARSGTFPLSREVERLVTVTYAPSLQNLYNLTQEVTPTLIDSWASHKPCQVGALAEVLVDGLSRSRLALPILASFGRAPEFRNCLLQRHPYLLDQFLKQSTGNDEEYLPVCIALLSSPLPRSTVPPASLAPFIMRMVGRIHENPSVENVRSLYSISGCLTGILGELPHDVMSGLQTELTKTLRDLKDHMGNLLCLATFARLASSWSSVEVPSWLQNVKNFFGPKRGFKTLDLVVLRVILACSANCEDLTAQQSAESIYLAIEICNTVDTAQRRCWIEGNSIKIDKLIEKATRDGIDHSVQILGLSFLASLLPASALSPGLSRLPLEWILPENSANVLEVLPSHILPRFVEASATHSHQYALNKALGYIFAVLSTSKPDSIIVDELRLASSLLDGLRASELPPLSPALITSMSKTYGDAVQNLVESFPRHYSRPDCEGVAACYHAVSNLENELIFDLLTFWLEMTLSQSIEQVASPSPEMDMLMKIMTKSKSMLPHSRCTFSDARPFVLRNCLSPHKFHERTIISRGNWRAGMEDIMAANSRMVNDSIMQKVEHICYELEQRCGSIEAPLKQAEEERNQQYLQAETLKRQTKNLEDELQVASNTISELREEMSRLEIYANSATSRAEELSMSLAEVQQALEDLQSTSKGTLSGEREAFRTRELDMIASLSAKDDHLEELQEQLKSQTEEHAQLETMLAAIKGERDTSLESIVTLNHEVSVIRAELEERDKEIQSLMAGKEVANNQFEELQAKVSKWSIPSTTQHTLTQSSIIYSCMKRRQGQKGLGLLSERQSRNQMQS